MKVIVSGATSMLGLAVTKQFLDNGHDVYAIVRPNSSKTDTLPKSSRLHVLEADLGQYEELKPVKADIFYHFAWAGTDKKSRQSLEIQMQNVQYTASALAFAAQCHCKKFIGAGSQAEYGKQKCLISEKTLPAPDTPYGIAKLSAGLHCMYTAKELDITCVWARIFSVYGVHDNKDTMIMSSVDKAVRGEKLCMSSCEQTWNYIYEDDAAGLFYQLGIRDVSAGVYNLANNKSRTLKEYVELMVKAIRRDGIEVPDPEFDASIKPTAYLNADTRKIYQATGYTPEVSFIKGIHRIIAERKNA